MEKLNNFKKEDSKKENLKNELILIPKAENYIYYMLDLILKLPRTEKFSIGTEYKTSMYSMLRQIIYLSKIKIENRFEFIIRVDSELNAQRIMLRIMKKYKWIDDHKFKNASDLIYELGKIIGGLEKYYGKNYKKSV